MHLALREKLKFAKKDLRSCEEKLNGQKGSFLVPPPICLPKFWGHTTINRYVVRVLVKQKICRNCL